MRDCIGCRYEIDLRFWNANNTDKQSYLHQMLIRNFYNNILLHSNSKIGI